MRDPDLPKVTFGIIVLNGEPFTRYCLRSLYPFAHEILVVEGAAPAAAKVATPDGHSTDGTLETLYRFKVLVLELWCRRLIGEEQPRTVIR